MLTFGTLTEDFCSAAKDKYKLLNCPSDFDRRLKGKAAEHIGRILDQIENGVDLYSWAADPDAFSSGIEAWLQHELLLTLTAGTPGPAPGPHKPAVVRVIDAEDVRMPWSIATPMAVFLLMPTNLIDRYVAFQNSVLMMTLHAPEPYEESDRWCRSNLMGGAHMEAAARGEMLGIAYAAALKFLSSDDAYATSTLLGEPDEWILHDPDESRGREPGAGGPGATDVETLIRAPLRFGLFQEWGHSLTHLFADQGRDDFGRKRSVDNTAISCLRTLEEDVRVQGAAWGEFFGRTSAATGMPIHLQMRRIDLLQQGLPDAVKWLCLSTDEGDRPPMTRLSQGEVMLRCASVATTVLHWRGDDWTASALLACVDEMQVFVTLVTALFLIRLGGTADLWTLQRVEWEAVLEYYEAGEKALEKYSPEELEEIFAEVAHEDQSEQGEDP